jgi:hypothetical protein
MPLMLLVTFAVTGALYAWVINKIKKLWQHFTSR